MVRPLINIRTRTNLIRVSNYIFYMICLSRSYNAVNHSAYRRGPTLKETIACRKRVFERIILEINLTMDRLTNPYKLKAGPQIPLMWSICNYVIL